MSIWIWLLIAATMVILFLVVRSSRQRSRDRAVLEDFRRWSAGHAVSEQPRKTGLGALSQREEQIRRDTATHSAGNPVCPGCRTAYDRAEVIRLIKLQSPEVFEFQNWTTKFVCKTCPTEIVISGVRGE